MGRHACMRGFSSRDSTRSRAAQIVAVKLLSARLTTGGPCAQLAECFTEAAHHREELRVGGPLCCVRSSPAPPLRSLPAAAPASEPSPSAAERPQGSVDFTRAPERAAPGVCFEGMVWPADSRRDRPQQHGRATEAGGRARHCLGHQDHQRARAAQRAVLIVSSDRSACARMRRPRSHARSLPAGRAVR